jgi:hypothetical protein
VFDAGSLIDYEMLKSLLQIICTAIKGLPAIDVGESCPSKLFEAALPPIRPAIEIDDMGRTVQQVLP